MGKNNRGDQCRIDDRWSGQENFKVEVMTKLTLEGQVGVSQVQGTSAALFDQHLFLSFRVQHPDFLLGKNPFPTFNPRGWGKVDINTTFQSVLHNCKVQFRSDPLDYFISWVLMAGSVTCMVPK